MTEQPIEPENFELEMENAQVAIAAGLYYLYRLVKCPYGDNYTGFQAWIKTSVVEPFKNVCERHIADSPHGVTEITCEHCGHFWVAVHPVNAPSLECPQCHQHNVL